MVARMFINSFISSKRGINLFSETRLVAISKRIQYLVSLASFKAIDNLWIKLAVLWAALDSSTFAPIEVPDLISCLDNALAVGCF
jgi:hypothetical protein